MAEVRSSGLWILAIEKLLKARNVKEPYTGLKGLTELYEVNILLMQILIRSWAS